MRQTAKRLLWIDLTKQNHSIFSSDCKPVEFCPAFYINPSKRTQYPPYKKNLKPFLAAQSYEMIQVSPARRQRGHSPKRCWVPVARAASATTSPPQGTQYGDGKLSGSQKYPTGTISCLRASQIQHSFLLPDFLNNLCSQKSCLTTFFWRIFLFSSIFQTGTLIILKAGPASRM